MDSFFSAVARFVLFVILAAGIGYCKYESKPQYDFKPLPTRTEAYRPQVLFQSETKQPYLLSPNPATPRYYFDEKNSRIFPKGDTKTSASAR